jgi:hypothetical protein
VPEPHPSDRILLIPIQLIWSPLSMTVVKSIDTVESDQNRTNRTHFQPHLNGRLRLRLPDPPPPKLTFLGRFKGGQKSIIRSICIYTSRMSMTYYVSGFGHSHLIEKSRIRRSLCSLEGWGEQCCRPTWQHPPGDPRSWVYQDYEKPCVSSRMSTMRPPGRTEHHRALALVAPR